MKNTEINPSDALDMMYDDPRLGVVVLSTEAQILWNKSRRQVWWAIQREQVAGRKAITGGAWLLTYDSCVDAWGEPLKTIEQVIHENVK